MKHLLSGVAIAAALAIAAPALAQAPMTPGAARGTAPTASAPAAAKAAPAKPAKKRAAKAARSGGKMAKAKGAGSDNSMTAQLNREELARVSSGGGMPPAGAPMPAQPMGGVRAGPSR